MSSNYFQDVLDTIPESTKKLVEKQTDLADYIYRTLKKKNITQKELANRMDVKESYLSRILSGSANITLKTIVNLELAIGQEILKIPESGV